MRIIGVSSAYDRFGASLLSDIADYVEPFLESVSPIALKIEVNSRHRTEAPTRPSLGPRAEQFAIEWVRLPLLRYRSKAGKITLDYASALVAEEALGYGNSVDARFPILLDELTLALAEAFAGSRSVSRDVDIAALAIALEQARQEAPRTPNAIAKALEVIRTARDAGRAERLKTLDFDEVDWSRYPAAVHVLLDDPIYWNSFDDDAPHGNDTGADLLTAFRVWRPRHQQDSPLKFLHGLLGKWDIRELSSDDRIVERTVTEAAIALAFAQIKTDASCDAEVAAQALEAIDRKLHDLANNAGRLALFQKLRTAIIVAQA